MRTQDSSFAASAFDFHSQDPAWPECLGELSEPPTRLRVSGTLPFLDHSVAIVGTRRCTAEGLAIARRIARDLARAGFVVISGGAEGIDAAAHEGALEGDGLGIAVLAGGLARPFPRRHTPLFARIASAGALISEARDDEAPRAHLFLARNRLIAALARAVIVIQAPLRSGALSTAAHARKLGRTLLAVPWTVNDPHGEGCVSLLAGGARACRDARDAIEAITGERAEPTRVKQVQRRRGISGRPRLEGAQLRLAGAEGPEHRALDRTQKIVLDALGSIASHADDIVRTTGLGASEVQTALTTLTLLGLVSPDDRGAYRGNR